MTHVRISGTIYPAAISGKTADPEWDGRESKSINLEMDYATASNLFVDGLEWSIVERREVPTYQMDEQGEMVLNPEGDLIQTGTEIQEIVWDNSEYSLAGDLTDHRDGTITAKMGKLTELEEAYEIMLGGL